MSFYFKHGEWRIKKVFEEGSKEKSMTFRFDWEGRLTGVFALHAEERKVLLDRGTRLQNRHVYELESMALFSRMELSLRDELWGSIR